VKKTQEPGVKAEPLKRKPADTRRITKIHLEKFLLKAMAL